jgi:hypothetical protein
MVCHSKVVDVKRASSTAVASRRSPFLPSERYGLPAAVPAAVHARRRAGTARANACRRCLSFARFCREPSADARREIARLQNSLAHLRRTQADLRAALPDPDVQQALDENEEVMCVHCLLSLPTSRECYLLFHRGSQEERIQMLTMALSHHGIDPTSVSHYTLAALEEPQPAATPARARGTAFARPEPEQPPQDLAPDDVDEDDDGIHL